MDNQTSAPAAATESTAVAGNSEPQHFGIFVDEDTGAPIGEPAAIVEDKKEEAPATDAKSERMAKHFAEMKRKDHELLQKKKALKEKESELAKYNDLRSKASTNPREVLSQLGVDFYKLAEDVLGTEIERPKDPESMTSKEVEELKQQLQAIEKQTKDWQYQQVMAAEKSKIHDLIKRNAESCELVAHHLNDGDYIINELIEAASQEFTATGKAPDYIDLIQRAEKVLEDQIYTSVSKFFGVKKIKDRFNAVDSDPKPAIQAKAAESNDKIRTLKNEYSAESTRTGQRPMTDADRQEEFIKLMAKGGWVSD